MLCKVGPDMVELQKRVLHARKKDTCMCKKNLHQCNSCKQAKPRVDALQVAEIILCTSL